MQKEAEEVMRGCQSAEDKAKKPPTEVGPLTVCLLLSFGVDGSGSQGARAKLQTKRIPLILHIASGRLADPSASVPILKN